MDAMTLNALTSFLQAAGLYVKKIGGILIRNCQTKAGETIPSMRQPILYAGEHYVGRWHVAGQIPGLGNPWREGQVLPGTTAPLTREQAIHRFKLALWKAIKTEEGIMWHAFKALALEYRRTGELSLVCHCAPLPCHGEVIAAAIEYWLTTSAPKPSQEAETPTQEPIRSKPKNLRFMQRTPIYNLLKDWIGVKHVLLVTLWNHGNPLTGYWDGAFDKISARNRADKYQPEWFQEIDRTKTVKYTKKDGEEIEIPEPTGRFAALHERIFKNVQALRKAATSWNKTDCAYLDTKDRHIGIELEQDYSDASVKYLRTRILPDNKIWRTLEAAEQLPFGCWTTFETILYKYQKEAETAFEKIIVLCPDGLTQESRGIAAQIAKQIPSQYIVECYPVSGTTAAGRLAGWRDDLVTKTPVKRAFAPRVVNDTYWPSLCMICGGETTNDKWNDLFGGVGESYCPKCTEIDEFNPMEKPEYDPYRPAEIRTTCKKIMVPGLVAVWVKEETQAEIELKEVPPESGKAPARLSRNSMAN